MPLLHSRLRRIRDNLHALRTAWTRHAEHADWPTLLDRPPGQRVLVLAPHPDDETIGCGGTLLKHVAAGDPVTCVYLTDGSRGNPDCPDSIQVARTRRREAEAAARVLGLNDLVFLGGADGALTASSELVAALRATLDKRQPDLVYVPFFLDPHPDHRAASDLLAAVVATGDFRFRCCAYETWSPLLPNVLVNVSTQMETKLRAIGQYRSQVARGDYAGLTRGLNRYRTAQYSHQIGYAEAFYLAGVHDYLTLIA